jgi:glucose-1-phosphate cytidylyltransferase
MRAVILAGGMGTRISEESALRPKPMIEIGTKPILWHIMKAYSAFGIDEFVVCLGYRGYMIKEYFANYYLHTADATFDLESNTVEVHEHKGEPWKVTLIDTGEDTATGGRLKRALPYVGEEDFCFTYGDGVAAMDMKALLEFHHEAGALATLTAVRPPGRFGALRLNDDRVESFQEKPEGDGGWINGGFFVLSPRVGEYIEGDATAWEREPLQGLAAEGQLAAYKHTGFWHAMDTMRDLRYLEELWSTGQAPWKVW